MKERVKYIEYETEVQMDKDQLVRILEPRVIHSMFSLSSKDMLELKYSVGCDRRNRDSEVRERILKNLAYSIQRVIIFQNFLFEDSKLRSFINTRNIMIPVKLVELCRMVNQYSKIIDIQGTRTLLVPTKPISFKQQIIGSKGGDVYKRQFLEDLKDIRYIEEKLNVLGGMTTIDLNDLLDEPKYNFDFNYNNEYKKGKDYDELNLIKCNMSYEFEEDSFENHAILMPCFKFNGKIQGETIYFEEDIIEFSIDVGVKEENGVERNVSGLTTGNLYHKKNTVTQTESEKESKVLDDVTEPEDEDDTTNFVSN